MRSARSYNYVKTASQRQIHTLTDALKIPDYLIVGYIHLGSSFWQSYELVEDYSLSMCEKSIIFFSNEKLWVLVTLWITFFYLPRLSRSMVCLWKEIMKGYYYNQLSFIMC